MFIYYNSRAFFNEDLARFKLLSLEMSERRCNIYFFRVICQKVIMKRASPQDSLCLSGPEDLWWPWEGLRKQKVEMDSNSFSSKRLNQHFVIVYWCKRLICFHITVYFYPSFLTTRCHRAELFPQGFGSSYPTEKYSSASNKELQLHCHFKDLDRPR